MTRHVVVLDDSRFMLRQTRALLEQRGYRVSCFLGPETLEPSALETASLVLVDVNMREVFGDDVIGYLKEQLAVRAPILLFSSIGEDELSRRATQAGADGYVLKAADIGAQVERFFGGAHV